MYITTNPRIRWAAALALLLLFSVASYNLLYIRTPTPPPPPAKIEETHTPPPSVAVIDLPGADSSTSASATPIKGTRVATIVETRPLDTLIPLLLHFSAVLGPDWPVILYTSRQNHVIDSAALRRHLLDHRVYIRFLPDEISFTTHLSVSQFLTQPWFWDSLAPADHILLFQADSIVCANAPQHADDFVKYDFIGAPIGSDMGHGYNGGLSLRNRTMMLDIIKASNFDADRTAPGAEDRDQYEDQWFHKKMTELPSKADGSPAANLPSEDIAKTWAVQKIYYEFPLGYHQVESFQQDHVDQIERWCPEIKLCTGELLACIPPIC